MPGTPVFVPQSRHGERPCRRTRPRSQRGGQQYRRSARPPLGTRTYSLGREPIPRHRSAGGAAPKLAVQLLLEEFLVMTGKPPGELVFVFDLNQVDTVCSWLTSAKVRDEAWAWLTPGPGRSRAAPRADRLAEWIRGWIHSAQVGIRHEQSWRGGLWNRSDRCGAGNRGGGGSRNDSFADPSGCDRPGRRRMAHLLLDRRPATRDVIDRLPLEEGADPRPRWSRSARGTGGDLDHADPSHMCLTLSGLPCTEHDLWQSEVELG
jgi:hypothetical protein